MKIGIIVLCRYDSNRLPGKILKQIHGKPILGFILERLQSINLDIPISVATSTELSDTTIETYCFENNIPVFRGSKHNVAKRFLDCANFMNVDFAIRINGDNLFTDPKIIQYMIKMTQSNRWDFLTNVPGRTFPLGISVEIINLTIFNSMIHLFNDYEKEHVMPYFYVNIKSEKLLEYKNTKYFVPKGCNLAIDTYEDFKNANHVIDQMQKPHWQYSTAEIIAMYETKVEIHG
jgi:spore coat polysaccharide biosynthesis protein SpsF